MTSIAPENFAALMAALGPWSPSRRVAVAVSGGADSLCLAWLAKTWGDPLALIVDHGLRPESAGEAREAASRLAGFGVAARVLTLRGLAAGPGLAARARAARYEALAAAAGEAGLSDLLLAHHAGDQAETLLIRQASGSGPRGLAGMAAVSETHALRIVRPLLGVTQGRLRATLRAANIAWAEDPSNRNPEAGRTRARQWLDDPMGNRPSTTALLAQAQVSGRARAAADARIADLLARRARIFPHGFAVLTPGPIEPACLAALIRMIGGAPYPPAQAAVARLAAGPMRGTLGGVRLMDAGRLGEGTLLLREATAMQPPVPARLGCIWDGRFRFCAATEPPEDATIGALGEDARLFRKATHLGSAILATLPAVRGMHGLVAVPHLGYFKEWTNPLLRLRLHPSVPAAGARFQVCTRGDAQPHGEHHVLGEAAAHPGDPVTPSGFF